MYIRILKAPRGSDGRVLSIDTTDPNKYEESGVLVNAPQFADGVYSKLIIFLSDSRHSLLLQHLYGQQDNRGKERPQRYSPVSINWLDGADQEVAA